MTACAFSATAWARPPGSKDSASRKRLAAALLVSAMLHALGTSFSGGGAPRARPSPATVALSARLVPATPSAVAENEPDAGAERVEPPRSPMEGQRRITVVAPRAPAPRAAATARSTDGMALAEAPDLNYYAARQLDVFPALLSKLQLGALAGGAGRALLLVLIDATGAVHDVSLVEASPASLPEEEVKRAFSSARFTPAYRNGRAVRSRMLIEVNYGADERANGDRG